MLRSSTRLNVNYIKEVALSWLKTRLVEVENERGSAFFGSIKVVVKAAEESVISSSLPKPSTHSLCYVLLLKDQSHIHLQATCTTGFAGVISWKLMFELELGSNCFLVVFPIDNISIDVEHS
ncbi:hypothetical protein POM88_035651 [Heracleum sosnowskyi]|uniref:Uncharacterized protein n=1 Tax=Heracleum sosnowskyi TaxID=360622 RepID=A0AAD8MEA3_9APIA|nr:hypothetical protein POM88_035651 [Heracleum sosnowskyi]